MRSTSKYRNYPEKEATLKGSNPCDWCHCWKLSNGYYSHSIGKLSTSVNPCDWCHCWKLSKGYYSSLISPNCCPSHSCNRCISSFFCYCRSCSRRYCSYCRHSPKYESSKPTSTYTSSGAFARKCKRMYPTSYSPTKELMSTTRGDFSAKCYLTGDYGSSRLSKINSNDHFKTISCSDNDAEIATLINGVHSNQMAEQEIENSDITRQLIESPINSLVKSPINSPSKSITESPRHSSINSPIQSPTNSIFKINSEIKTRDIKPLGFQNPQGYCFLNCVLQVLRGCLDFNTEILKLTSENNVEVDDDNFRLLKEVCNLFSDLDGKNVSNVDKSLGRIQKYFRNESEGDDVHKCYLQLLTKLHKGLQNIDTPLTRCEPGTVVGGADYEFQISRSQNKGFIFDLFYGQMCVKTKCTNCQQLLNEKYSLFKSIALPVQKYKENATVDDCIEAYLQMSRIEDYDSKKCDCAATPEEYGLEIQITHAPKYLLLYLNRGSYFENGEKNNEFITSENWLKLPTANGFVNYQLISVVDHVGDNEAGHYYCKCSYEVDQWWLISDTQVTESRDIVTDRTIVFLYKQG